MLMVIKGGKIIDPGASNHLKDSANYDIIIEDGIISHIVSDTNEDRHQTTLSRADKIIDATGKYVVPGLIDMHVHLREPGYEYKETISTGALAAVHGGFTAICPMPNTKPVNDNSQITQFIIEQANAAGLARVFPVAAISPGSNGKGLNEYGDLKNAGAVALSDDGHPVSNSQLMRRAMEYAKGFNLPIISHCEDLSLVASGVMNEGDTATAMGLGGIPNAAESVMVTRDIMLCELTGASLHIAHVSTKESVDAIRQAKKKGLPVTAETAPHYFTLTDKDVFNYNTNAKMNPPLRSKDDVDAIKAGLADGTIDVIATDHAPHSILEKDLEFDKAANGIIGLETSLPLSLKLVEQNVLSFEQVIEKMSCNPAKILRLKTGIIAGNSADITIVDVNMEYTVDIGSFKSKSKNSPFNNWEMKGKAVYTIVGGKIVFQE